MALEAIRIDPGLSEAYAAAALAMTQDGAEAAVTWLAARELACRDAGARIAAGRGDLWADSLARSYPRACMGYARSCLARRDYSPAIAQLAQLMDLDRPDRMGSRYVLGSALLMAGVWV